MATIINKTIEGISWSFKSQFITQVIQFLVGLLLMRWIAPNDFGKFAMVLVVVSFLQIIRDSGFTVAVIQKKETSNTLLSTAFWFQIFVAFIISAFLFFSGPLFNSFYEETVLNDISFWLSIDFLLGTIGLVPTALLRKEMRFKALFYVQFFSITISSIVGITMAINGMGYLSLVGKIFSYTIISSCLSFSFSRWKPSFRYSKNELKALFKIGLPDTGNHILWYITMNVDDFLIGRVIGSGPLGFYNRAYTIMLLPMANLSSVLKNVLFSTWSKMQDDVEGINKMYLKVTGIIALIVFPAMTFLAIFSKPIVRLVFGENWLPMANTLSILSIIGMFQSVSAILGIIFIVFNKNKLAFKINVVSSLFTVSLVIWSVYTYKSIEVTAFVYGLSSLIILYPNYYYASKIMGIPLKNLTRPMIYPLIFSFISSGFGWFLFKILTVEILLLKLILVLFGAFILYYILCMLFRITPLMNLFNAIKFYKSDTRKSG